MNCPKCGKPFPVSEMFLHSQSCKGINPLDVIPIWPTTPLQPIKQDTPKLIKPEVNNPSFCPKCGTEFIVNELYKVCTSCKTIKARPKIWWWIIFRYGFMIAWICLAIGFILGIATYHSVIHP